MPSTFATPLRLSAAGGLAVATVLLSYAVGTAHGGGDSAAAATPAPTGVGAPAVTVDGVGRTAGTPDVLRLDLGVERRAATVSGALDAANAALAKVRDSLRARGVAPADLQTSSLTVRADYDYAKEGPRLRGYVAEEGITARLHRLGSAGRTITEAVAAGGSAVRVNGITLDIESDDGLVAQARDRAFAAARSKAEQYARLAGRVLGPVTSVTESVTRTGPEQVKYAAAASARAPAPVPVEAGSQEVSVTVAVVWSLR